MNPKKGVKRCEKLKIKELPQATRSSRPSGTRGIKPGPRKVHSRRLVSLSDDCAVRRLQPDKTNEKDFCAHPPSHAQRNKTTSEGAVEHIIMPRPRLELRV